MRWNQTSLEGDDFRVLISSQKRDLQLDLRNVRLTVDFSNQALDEFPDASVSLASNPGLEPKRYRPATALLCGQFPSLARTQSDYATYSTSLPVYPRHRLVA